MYNQMYYNNFFPYQNMAIKPVKKGLIAGLSGLGKINWGSFLTNTQKTLNVINQAIPVYYQIKPIYNNARTIFKVFGAMNDKPSDTNVNNIIKTNTNVGEIKKNISSNQPIFFT